MAIASKIISLAVVCSAAAAWHAYMHSHPEAVSAATTKSWQTMAGSDGFDALLPRRANARGAD
jgi:hypothetical protein